MPSAEDLYAQKVISLFQRRHGNRMLYFAFHASLPVVITPELLNLIRINFFYERDMALPFSAELDLLFSELCQLVDKRFALYEFDRSVRESLLKGLENKFGNERVKEVASLLYQYSEKNTPWVERVELERAQQLTALNFLNPAKAEEWLQQAERAKRSSGSIDDKWFVAVRKKLVDIGKLSSPPPAAGFFTQGLKNHNNQEYEEALSNLTEAIRIHPSHSAAYYYRGKTYQALADFQAAINDFRNAVELDPANADAYKQLGNLYFSINDKEKAVFYLQKAVELDPSEIGSLEQLGQSALPILTKLISSPEARVRLDAANLLAKLGEASLPVLGQSSSDPDPAVRSQVAKLLGASSNPEIALPALYRFAQDKDAGVRSAAVSALAEYYPQDTQILPLLQEFAVRDVNASVRSAAVLALAQHESQYAQTLPLLRELAVQDVDASVRRNAINALARMGETAAALQIARQVPDEYKRASLLLDLAPHLPQELLAEVLEDINSMRDARLRESALRSLAPYLPGLVDLKSDKPEIEYDVYISNNGKNREWVRNDLLPSLETAGLRVLIDFRDFEVGKPALENTRQAVRVSRHILAIITPEWLSNEWPLIENLISDLDPLEPNRKLIPVLLEPSVLPRRIQRIISLDFTSPALRASQMPRLIKALKPDSGRDESTASGDLTKGLSASLRSRIRAVLLQCSEFESYDNLRAVFVTAELRPFRVGIRNADNMSDRVDFLLEYLLEQKLTRGKPVLPVFLATLRDRYSEGDSRREALTLLLEQIQSLEQPKQSREERTASDALTKGLSASLLSRMRKVLLDCEEFESEASLRAVFSTEELAPLRYEIPLAHSMVARVDGLLTFIFPRNLPNGKPALSVLLDTLRMRYPDGDSRREDLTKLLEEIQSLAQPELTTPPNFVVSRQILDERLLTLGFRPQVRQFREAIEQNRIAAFLVHGPPKHGQRLLTRRLTRFRREWEFGRRIVMDAASNGIGKSFRALHRQVARQVQLAQDTSINTLAEKVCEWWKTRDVIFVVYSVDYIAADILSVWIDEFWKPISMMAREKQPLTPASTHLLLFLVDFAGHVAETNVTFLEQPAQLMNSHAPLKLPPNGRFREEELESWIEYAAEILRPGITAAEVMSETDGGVPELVYERIFQLCGLHWENE